MNVLVPFLLAASIGVGSGIEALPNVVELDTVIFRLDMTRPIQDGWFDPSTETVGVRGSFNPLTWETTLPAMDPDGDATYVVEVMFKHRSDSQRVEYKIKVDGVSNPNSGWETGSNGAFVLTGGKQIIERAFSAPFESTLTGNIQRHNDFGSEHVLPRDVYVYLPPGYGEERDRRYPVLYMHDGANVFDSYAMGMEWEADETAEQLITDGAIEPVIIVGIGNTDERVFEYTPTSNRWFFRRKAPGGGADLYGRFIAEELKPFIDGKYRTLTGPEHTALGGSSLGGIATMYLGTKYSHLFGGLLVVSPSVWWDNEYIVGYVREAERKADQRIWLDIGTAEGEGAVDGGRRLRKVLLARGWQQGADLMYVEDEGAVHNEVAWAGRMEGMLRFLFGKNGL